jgi:hypothetical protein
MISVRNSHLRLWRGIVILMLVLYPLSVQADKELEVLQQAQGIADLHLCREAGLGIELLCNRNWKQEIDKDKAVLMVISQEPAVLLTVARAKEPVTGIEELTQDELRRRGQYAKGFKMERLEVGGLTAINVQGYSEGFPEMRLSDFYVVHDYQLYSFLFSVDPGEEWPNYSVLCTKIIESVRFADDGS